MLNFENYPNKSFYFSIFSFRKNFTINIKTEIEKKLGTQKLTNELALSILKKIKLFSDIKAILTKPIVFIPSAILITAAAMLMPVSSSLLLLIGLTLSVIGGSLLGIAIREYNRRFLRQLSEAYRQQSEKAAEYIQALEQNTKLVPIL